MLIATLATALVYYVAARLGVSLAFHQQAASLVWPASGIALVAALIFGPSVIPGIVLASMLSALRSGAPPMAALGIALGNGLGTWAGAYLLRDRTDFRVDLARFRDVFLLLVVGGGVAALVGSSIATFCLALRGTRSAEGLLSHWLVWASGDVTGVVTVAPLILVWCCARTSVSRRGYWPEFLLLFALLTAVSLVAFGSDAVSAYLPLAYLVFPFAVWAVLRFEQRGAVTMTAIVTAVAIAETLRGLGPFMDETIPQTLLNLQAFVWVVATSMLVLATLISERRMLLEEQEGMLQREMTARLEAQRAVAAREKVLAVVSHEVRNPLATVLLNSSAMQESLARSHGPSWEAEAAQSVVTAAEQIEHLIRDLTDVTRLEAGQISFERVPQAPETLVRQALQLLQPLAAERRLELECRVATDLPPVLANRERILQVFSNLIGNAIQLTPAGGRITVMVDPHASGVRFTVRDTGPGIAKDRIPELLTPYWQSPMRSAGRRGLGIPIARAIIDAHEGGFWIQSREGEGSAFHFTLPAATG